MLTIGRTYRCNFRLLVYVLAAAGLAISDIITDYKDYTGIAGQAYEITATLRTPRAGADFERRGLPLFGAALLPRALGCRHFSLEPTNGIMSLVKKYIYYIYVYIYIYI